jgi:peroxiredoxin 2/4
MSLVGKRIPEFQTNAVVKNKIQENFSLEDFKGQYVLLFFYPLDFTFVCPTELHAFQERLADFKERGCQVVGASIDSAFSHLAWLSQDKMDGGIKGVEYPLIADVKKQVAQAFDVLKEDDGIAYRALFLMDKDLIVRHQVVNDLGIGRSVDEALRTLDALIFTEKHGQVCPANWNRGKKAMTPTSEGLKEYTRS